MRMHSGKRHLLGTKKANRMRRLKKLTQVHPAVAKNVHEDAVAVRLAGTVILGFATPATQSGQRISRSA